jgi:hypothetical protein
MRAEVFKGHLDGLLLASLEAGPLHGDAVMEALRAGSGGRVDLPTGTVYRPCTAWSGPGCPEPLVGRGRPPSAQL